MSDKQTTMTDDQFWLIFTEAVMAADRDIFVSDFSTSSIWGDDPESDTIPAQRIEQLGNIWDTAHATIRDIRKHTGLTQAAFAKRFCIPKRTLEDWERGVRSCADYTRLLLAQATGFYQRPGM